MRGAVGFNEMGDVMAASVGRMLETTHGNHIVYLNGFNPVTDEVVIVKKGSQRAWVDTMDGVQYMHNRQPKWSGSSWHSNQAVESTKLFGSILENDCVEFVAAKTHRPPVAQEVAEPVAETVPELSDEGKVKAVYPDAYYNTLRGVIRGTYKTQWHVLSASFGCEADAWFDAARKIEQEVAPSELESQQVHNFGCGVEVVSGAVLAN